MINAITGLPNRTSHMRENVIIDGNLTVVGTLTVLNQTEPSAYPLGEAASFVMLSSSALTVTTPQLVTGNVGELVLVGAMVFLNGQNYQPAPAQALADATALYATLTALTPTYTFVGASVALDTVDVGNGTGVFTPGIYNGDTTGQYATTSSAGIVTLDGAGDYVFLFETAGGYIDFGAGTNIQLINGATAARVFWVVKDYLSTGANTIFNGNAVSMGYVTTGADAYVTGRLISLDAPSYITVGVGSTITIAN